MIACKWRMPPDRRRSLPSSSRRDRNGCHSRSGLVRAEMCSTSSARARKDGHYADRGSALVWEGDPHWTAHCERFTCLVASS